MLYFANFKFWVNTLFSKIMPNFCRPHAMSIHKILQFPWYHFIDKLKLMLYPRVRNSITHLTLVSLFCY